MTVAPKSGGGGNAYYLDGIQQRSTFRNRSTSSFMGLVTNSSNGHPMLLSTTQMALTVEEVLIQRI